MKRKMKTALVVVGAVAVLLPALWLMRMPATPLPYSASLVPLDEQARTIEAMKPPKRARPVVAVLALNEGTETTDFIVPFGVLAESGAADVFVVAPEQRTVQLEPALKVEPKLTTAVFSERYPDGADYVIVPKISVPDDEKIISFIRAQSERGATIVGICAGGKTVAAAGLVDGRRATIHWYDVDELQRRHPTMQYVPDRRYVADRGVITTTGVSASLPVSIALVEAIAGRDRAREVANTLGVESWDARHDSAAFRMDRRSLTTAVRNDVLAKNDALVINVSEGVDEVALAFSADAWSRTRRSRAFAVTGGGVPVKTRRGLVLVPDAAQTNGLELPAPREDDPARSLPETLAGIARRYGPQTAAFVALQLEFAWTSG